MQQFERGYLNVTNSLKDKEVCCLSGGASSNVAAHTSQTTLACSGTRASAISHFRLLGPAQRKNALQQKKA